MAEKMMFGIGFDLEQAVKDAEKDFDGVIKRLQNAAEKEPINLSVETKVKGIEAANGSISKLREEMARLSKQLESMSNIEKFDGNGLKDGAKSLIQEYAAASASLERYGQSLQQVVNTQKQAAAQDKQRYNEWLRQKNQEAIEHERVEKQKQAATARTIAEQNKEYERQAAAEQKRQAAIAASLRAEYKKIEIKRQAEAASRRELEMLNAQYRAEEARNRLAQQDARIKQLNKLRTVLQAEENSIAKINAKLQIYRERLQSTEIGSRQFNQTVKEIDRLSAALDRANNKIQTLSTQSASGSRRLASAANETARAYSSTDGYISRLIKRTAVLFGITQVTRFAQRVREVTAEFELQRVSLGAIIQDTERANALFNQIKTFAIQSPFEIKDLVGYVKQLSAYRIETDKLFDTTKRLADVSAGLGVDMGRLILAYGQVKAASVLRGQEVRQFTEAGIPLIQLLAEKFTKLRGEVVSTSEVFDLVSKRAVSFEMVAEIFEDMTNAGGMFYNMQEKQARTLAGQWSNLKDSLSIMYDEMGNTAGVQSALKGVINLVKSLAENWKTTYQVVEGSAVAFVAMSVAAKNMAIQMKAVSLYTATYNAILKQQAVQIPKVVTALMGNIAAHRLSVKLTKMHTAAVARHAAATNVLTKSFWKLTAAMLSNPWVLVTGAIAGAAYAIYRFSTNAETADDRVKKLNNSVGSLQSFESKINPLKKEYDDLSKKVERTAEEEKKLKAVTKELAKEFPSAVKSVSEFGDEIELVDEKLQKLYNDELQARKENKEKEIADTKAMIDEKRKKIESYQNAIGKLRDLENSGFKRETYAGDIQKAIDKIDELNAEIAKLEAALNAANEELRQMNGEEKVFTSWRKTLQDFRKEVKTTKGETRELRLFSDTDLEQFNSLDEALQKTAEEYKKNKELVDEYNRTLESKNLTQAERDDVTYLRDTAKAYMDMDYAALAYYNQLKLIEEKQKAVRTPPDDRLSRLKEEVSLLEKVYAKYKEYTKYVSASDAQERINREFGETLAIFKKYGIELPKTSKEFQDALRTLQDMMKKLPKSQKDVMELGFKIENVDWDDTKKNLEDELKRLAADVAKTKTAREFFNRMLNLTGDMQLSANVTMSVYGETGAGLFDKMKAEIVKQFGEFDVTLAFDTLNEVIDYNKLEELYETYRDKIPEKYRDGIEKMIADNKKLEADNVRLWTEQLAKAKDFEQQRTDIVRQETENRIRIIKSGQSQEVKDSMIQLSQDYEKQQLAKIDVEEFKASEDYIKIFQDLDKVSNDTIDRLIANLERLIEKQREVGGEGTEGMKTLADALEKLKGVKQDRQDPLVGMIQSVKDYIAAKKEQKQAELDYATAAANYDLNTKEIDLEMNEVLKEKEQIQQNIVQAENEELLAKQQLKELEEGGATPEDIALAEQQVANATALVKNLKSKQEEIEKRIKKLIADRLKEEKELGTAEKAITKAKDKGAKAADGFNNEISKGVKIANNYKQVFDGLNDIATEFFGVSEDSDIAVMFSAAAQSMQLMSTVLGIIIALQEVFNITTAENPYMAIAMAVLAVAAAIAAVISNQKVKNANKEIAKQQEILDALERSYKRLQKEADKLFGSQFVDNIKQQHESLLAQIDAKEKQLNAEQSKGKKTNDDTVKGLKDDIDDLKDSYEDLQTTVSETMLGTDLKSAAETFAQSWLDAYKEFGDTRKAIEGEMKTMMENLIVQAVLGQVMKKALEPVFTMIDNMKTGDFYDEKFWQNLSDEAKKSTDNMDAGASNMMKFLEKAGINVREMGSGLSGIAKDIAQASEESILGLAAGINTQNYYMSHIDATVSQIAAMMTGGGVDFSSNEQIADLITMQNEHLAHLPSIALYTSQTAERCERAARACEDMADNLNRVIKPVGVKGSYAVNTAL